MGTVRIPTPQPGVPLTEIGSSKRDPSVEVVLPGWRDLTSLFTNACDGLPLGQTVHVPGYTMLDTMGSIEIMEARTDNGMAPDVEQLLPPEENAGQVPAFNADRLAREYTAQDVVFIMDRLLASQVAFHEVSPLSVSVYPCLWLQPQHAAQFTSAIAQPALADRPAQQALLLALAATCSVTLTSISSVYQELVKYNVVEMEDFISDKAGLTILDTSLPPESAVAGLQRAQQRLRSFAADPCLGEDAVNSICLRMSLLERLVAMQALLANMPANVLEIKEHFGQHASVLRDCLMQLVPPTPVSNADQHIWPLQSPNLRDAPSDRAASTFDVWTYRRLIAPVPVRPRVLPTPARTRTFFSIFLYQLQDAVSRLLLPGNPDHLPEKEEQKGFATWTERFSHAALALAGAGSPEKDIEVPGYARSIQLTALCSSAQGYAINATRTLDWFGYSFLALGAGVTMEDVAGLMQAIDFDDNQLALAMQGSPYASPSLASYPAQSSIVPEQAPPPRPAPAPQLQQPIGPRLRDILSRLPGLIIADLHVMGQHPSRAHRNLASGKDLLQLADTLAELMRQVENHALSALPFVPVLERLHLALLAFYQLGAMHVPLLGLRLELYPAPSSDSDAPSAPACAVWLAATLAARRAETLEKILRMWPVAGCDHTPPPPDRGEVKQEWQLMQALAAFQHACHRMTYLYVRSAAGHATRPPRPMRTGVRATLLAQRFRWLRRPGIALGFGPQDCSSAEQQYETSCRALRELVMSDPCAFVEDVRVHLQRAREHASLLLASAEPGGDVLWTLSHGRAALARTLITHVERFLAQLAPEGGFVRPGAGSEPAWVWEAGTWIPSRSPSSEGRERPKRTERTHSLLDRAV